MLEFKYDTQLLIEGENLDEDEISEYFTEHFKGDCLLAVGDDELIKIHFHTNEPWKVLEYCASLGEIYDIVVEDMDRQSRGLKGSILACRRFNTAPEILRLRRYIIKITIYFLYFCKKYSLRPLPNLIYW